MRMVLALILLLSFPSCAMAQETIVSYDKSSLSVLNEELRQSSSSLRNIKAQIADILPIDLTADVSGVLPIANGGTGSSTPSTAVFGSWSSPSTYTSGTVYQATGDMLVYGTQPFGSTAFVFYTDSSNPPTTIRTSGSGTFNPISCAVKKNDYWKITITGASGATLSTITFN